MRFGRALAPILLTALVAACSGAAGGTSPTSAPATAAPAAAAPATAAPDTASPAAAAASPSGGDTGYGGGYGKGGGATSQPAGGSIALATTSLGTILVGPTGMTLYAFSPDTSTSSACNGGCAASWPPLAGPLPALGAGLAAADFGSLTRSDGTKQVTFHGHPLYYFGGDTAAGDTKGQGLSQKWYVLGADGNPIH